MTNNCLRAAKKVAANYKEEYRVEYQDAKNKNAADAKGETIESYPCTKQTPRRGNGRRLYGYFWDIKSIYAGTVKDGEVAGDIGGGRGRGECERRSGVRKRVKIKMDRRRIHLHLWLAMALIARLYLFRTSPGRTLYVCLAAILRSSNPS